MHIGCYVSISWANLQSIRIVITVTAISNHILIKFETCNYAWLYYIRSVIARAVPGCSAGVLIDYVLLFVVSWISVLVNNHYWVRMPPHMAVHLEYSPVPIMTNNDSLNERLSVCPSLHSLSPKGNPGITMQQWICYNIVSWSMEVIYCDMSQIGWLRSETSA